MENGLYQEAMTRIISFSRNGKLTIENVESVLDSLPDIFDRLDIVGLCLYQSPPEENVRSGLFEIHQQLVEETKSEAGLDSLTGLLIRKRFEEQAVGALESAKRYGEQLSIAMYDIDHFKIFNDTYGHPRGDQVIRGVAGVLKVSRRGDIIGRYGGEEFITVMPKTGTENAVVICDRVNAKAKQIRIANIDETIMMTTGITTYDGNNGGNVELDMLIRQADAALYWGKKNGRNQVVPYPIVPKVFYNP